MHYTGNPATASDIGVTLQAVTTSANIRFPPVLNAARKLAAVRVTDLHTRNGASAEDTTGWVGTRVGTPLPLNCSVHLAFKIAQRYKGGKPRIALPFLDEPDTSDGRNWNPTPLNDAGTAFTSHMQELKTQHGGITIDQQVAVSYYSGFTVHTNTQNGRVRMVPTLKPTPDQYTVTSITPKALMGSSRRRLRAHTGAP